MKLEKLAGATSEIWQIFIQDSSSTTGAGLTGLTSGSSGLTAYYHRDTDTTATAISLVTMTVGTFTSSGFKEIDATNMPGWYQFCPPNAAIAASAKSCGFHLKGATNMAPLPIEVQLVAYNPDDAVHLGLSALPNTAVTTNASLLTSGTGTDQLSVASGRIDAGKILGTAIATPATAGILDVNVKNMNNVAATSITTINANQGTTQPVNFTGTAGSALVKGDMVDVAGSAVSTSAAQLGVNVVNINAVSAASVTTVSANQGTTQPVNFTGTGASALAKSDMVDIAGAAVSTTSAQLGVNAVQINAVSAASVTTINANQGTTQPVNFTGTGASALVKGDTIDIAGVATAATRIAQSTQGIVTGTVGSASTTTSIVTSALAPSNTVIDQFKGRIVTFLQNTTTANLRGQSTDITAANGTGTLTVTALTDAPVSGDTFVIT